MIYLLKSPSWKPGYIRYKVGYASDVQRRIQQYEPETYLVGTRPGEVMDEQILHRRLKLLPGIKILRNEWYIVREGDSCVHIAFHEPKRKIEEEVWKTLNYSTDVRKDIYLYLRGLGFQSNLSLSMRSTKFYIDELMKSYCILSDSQDDPKIKRIFKELSIRRHLSARLKFICEENLDEDFVLNYIPDTDRVKSIFLMAGPDFCRANSYIPTEIEKVIGVKYYSKNNLKAGIYGKFQVGQKYDLKLIKEELTLLYNDLSYQKTPKAKDLEEFFEVRKFQSTDPTTKKRVHGYELLRRLL
jgi:hypothetical protein